MTEKETIKHLEQKIKQLEKESENITFSEKILQTLLDISNAVSRNLTLYELYETIYKSLNNLMNLPNFYIAIYDRESHKIHFPFFVDQYDTHSYYELNFLEEKSLTGEVILRKEPILLTEEMLLKRAQADKIIGTVSKIYIGIPLIVQQDIIGVIAVQSYSDPGYFNKNDQDILTTVSNQIATAIDRKRKLDQIDLLQNYLFNIINSMPSIIVGINKENIITQWNSHAAKEIGVQPELAVGKEISEVFPRLAENLDQIQKSIEMKKIQTFLKQGYQKDGETRYEDIIIFPLITNGVEGAVIRIDDVTERVRIDEMMVQSEKMLSIGGLAAGMAHEINNPLAGIIQTANVMSRRLSKETKLAANLKAAEEAGISINAVHKYMKARGIPQMLSAINESGRQIAVIVENMLGFARKSDGSNASYNPVELLDQILELASADYNLKNQYDFKSIEIQKNYAENLPLLHCEKSDIQQVLLNILMNGAQAMQERKKQDENYKAYFTLRLSQDMKQKMINMEIEDNGSGMNEEVKKRIFEPFFTTKPIGVGTGLGLSVSYFIIVEKHRGEMTVESTPGVGTKFILRLPL